MRRALAAKSFGVFVALAGSMALADALPPMLSEDQSLRDGEKGNHRGSLSDRSICDHVRQPRRRPDQGRQHEVALRSNLGPASGSSSPK